MIALASLLLASSFAGLPSAQESAAPDPLRVHIRAGVKTHGPGEHDHPRFLEEWVPILEERGVVASGGMEFPTAEELAATDVLVLYAAEGASIHGDERERLDSFLARGGGLVVLHDAVCGDDPHWFKEVAGGAWEHGHSRWHEGEIGLYFEDRDHPITRGVSNFDFDDEVYWDLHLSPDAHVLANGFHTPFDVTPQMWTYEKDDYRAFVSLQGHKHKSFSHHAWRTLLLRGIAWAGKRDADLLVHAWELAALRYPDGGPQAPEKALKSLVLHPEFEASLVASEPLVVNPISIDWDEHGRMWVANTPGYPFKEESSGIPAHDEIVILEDIDGDGRMDTPHVFAGGLDLVTSLVFHRQGIIVTAAPDIWYLADTNGDDVADERTLLFTGFGYRDTHATISNMRWGMDGWIYATQGYSGNTSNVSNGLGVEFGRIGNGIFRFKPDGSAIEMVVSYGSNTWGLDFSWDGELFFTMANGSHLRHVIMPDSVAAETRVEGATSWIDITDHKDVNPISKHDRPPYQQIDHVGGFTAASGSLIYSGGAWPAEFDGNHFVCEPTVNLVHRDVVEPPNMGGLAVGMDLPPPSYKASKKRHAEFLASEDLWFRPVHVRTGPDGALYVLDFYNQAAVHNDTRGPQHGPTNAAVRPDRDRLHGRIWRIQHRGAVTYATPGLDSPEAQIAALSHPNRWWRIQAQRKLQEQPLTDESQASLTMLAESGSAKTRVHALWVLQNTDRLEDPILNAALDERPQTFGGPVTGLRKNAARLSASPFRNEAPTGLWDALSQSTHRTRLEALRTIETYPFDHERTQELVDAYCWGGSKWTRSAALASLLKARLLTARHVFSQLGGPLAFELDFFRQARLLGECGKRIASESGAQLASFLEMLARAEAGSPVPEIHSNPPHTWLQHVLAKTREGIRPDTRLPAKPETLLALQSFLDHEAIQVNTAALPLAGLVEPASLLEDSLNAMGDRLSGVASDPDSRLVLRLDAVDVLLTTDGQRTKGIQVAPRFLDPYFDVDSQARVIDALGRTADDGRHEAAVSQALLDAYPALSPPSRERIFHILSQKPARVNLLLDRVESGAIGRNDLGTSRVHRLRTHADAAISKRANEILGATASDSAAIDALVARLLPAVTQPGDAARGKELFATNCATCHSFEGDGAHVGPDLTGMGAHGAEALLPIILDPNRTVEAAYLEYIAETVDGKTFAGVIVRETAHEVVLRSSAGEESIRRDELASLRSTGRSPMPTGFEELGDEGLRDLFTYLGGSYSSYRVVDLAPYATSNTERGLYDEERDAKPMRFQKHGVVDLEGVPFEILDPERELDNALVLKGGLAADWESKLARPQAVEIPVGHVVQRMHVLGGVAAWGFPFTQSHSPILRWTWIYEDGVEEEVVMNDGDRFADWIRRHDVPGSVWVDGILADGSWGQVRRFTLDPKRPTERLRAIRLESFDNHLAPTLFALTAQLAGASDEPPIPVRESVPARKSILDSTRVLIFGGGSSHDFRRWFDQADQATLAGLGGPSAYTELHDDLGAVLDRLDVLVLCNNQPLPDPALRARILAHVRDGGSLLLVHAATWFNWADWPEYNAELVGGGARSHEAYGTFEVRVSERSPEPHAILDGVPKTFRIADELYRFQPAAEIDVLATGHSLSTGESYPVLWVKNFGRGRIVGLTLGHDGGAHEHDAYRTILRNAVLWLSR